MYFELSDGEISLWIEQKESICIKAITKFGDPVELSSDEANKLAKALLEMIRKIENE